MENQEGYSNQTYDANMQIRDLADKQKILKDRLLLIGKNLVDFKEKNEEDLLEIKKSIEAMKRDIEKMAMFFDTISSELPKFAKREDLEILSKQAKMFQPLEFIKKNS